MNAFNILSNPVADALGWTLLHAVWQGFALVLPMALILHFLRNQSSVLRYQMSVCTLLAQLMLSVGTFIWYYNPVAKPIYSGATLLQGSTLPIRFQTVTQALPWPQQVQHFLEGHLSQFVLIYLIGVALFGCRLAGGWLYLRQLSQRANRPTTIVWDHLTDKLRLALNLRMVVQVRESARIATPMVVGMLKPIILVPLGLAAHLSTYEMEAILAHELAHVKRHDYAVNLLQSVIEVLYFFHPALWWLSARVREEREHCCDDLALQACGGNGRILAQALAHVEELRLSQNQQTPALAMAFTSKQKQLLHRVRRVLGVPTRPFISNSSLAGLTLATILLMSVSVYAVQKQSDYKPKSVQPQPTRRHKVDNTSEYGMTDRNTIRYVVWKGKKLSSRQVAKLQSQLSQVMDGQLSLDNVPQPNQDILLTIIEKNSASNVDMAAMIEDISHIDYDNIIASSLNNVTLDANGLANVDYNGIVTEALASVPRTLQALPDSLDKLRMYHQQQMDSLSRLMDQQSRRLHTLHLQMEKMQFPIEELQRQQEVLNWRKEKLMTQRNALIDKHQRLLQNDAKQKLNTADVEKQLEALQPEIQKLESSMEELNKQTESLDTKQAEANLPMEKLQQESEQIQQQMDKLSEAMDKQGEDIGLLLPEIDRNIYGNGAITIARSIRAPKAPRSARATTIRGVATLSAPPAAVAPLRGRVGVAAPARPPVPPAPAAKSIKPATAPKPATATVPKVSRPTKPE